MQRSIVNDEHIDFQHVCQQQRNRSKSHIMLGMPSVHCNVTRSLKGSTRLDQLWQFCQRVREDLGHGDSARVWEGNDVAT